VTKAKRFPHRAGWVLDAIVPLAAQNVDAHMQTAASMYAGQRKEAAVQFKRAGKYSRVVYQALVYLRAGDFDEAERILNELQED